MPFFNPVTQNNFYVFLANAPFSTGGEQALAANSALFTTALSFIVGAFSEITGLDADMDVQPYNEGGRNRSPRQFMARGKFPPLVLKRGVTVNTDMWDWHSAFLIGSQNPIRKHGLIILTDRSWAPRDDQQIGPSGLGLPIIDKPPIGAWYFLDGIPQKLSGPIMSGKNTTDVAVEELWIAHEGLFRVGPGLLPGGVGDLLAGMGL